ncbi:MAG: hypothetical protein ABI678_13145 [Kofleriaceae bacterium]
MKTLSLVLVALTSLVATAAADNKLHVSTDVVTWDKPLSEAQCLDTAKAAIGSADAKLTLITASHAVIGTKAGWVVSADCLQSFKLNGAYVTVSDTGSPDDHKKVATAVSKALGGKSEMYK